MNRIEKLFQTKNKNILSVYFTAGFPSLDSTAEIINALDKSGIDMIEVGVPFSDPMADGPTIQHSSTIALRNGMTMPILFEQIKNARKISPDIPLVLMGYLNPMMQYGIENMFKKLKEVGVDALIIPDLPFDDYIQDFRQLARQYDIPMIMLITPETSEERIRLIDENCDGFIYMVSAASTTGTRERFNEEQLNYFDRVNSMNLYHNRLIGFGISNAETMKDVCEHSSGAIIGSLFIKLLQSEENVDQAVRKLLTVIGR